MQAFADAYFENVNNFLEFQVVRAQYLGQSSEAVVAALLELLKDDASSIAGRVNDRATQSLITLAQKSDTVKPALVQWIEQHQHEAYVGNGIDALWELTK